MTRSTWLRTAALVPVLMLAQAVSAQAVKVGPDAAPAAPVTAAAGTDADADMIIVTGSRIRRDPLNQDSPVVVLDQAALAQTGLSSVADILQRLPSASGGLNSKVNNSGNLGNPPDGGGVGAGSAEIDPALPQRQAHAGARRRHPLRQRHQRQRHPGDRRSQHHSGQQHPADRGAAVGRVGTVRLRCHRRRRQHHHQGGSRTGLQASAQFGTFRQGDGHTQDYNLSYGINGPTTHVVFGASYVKQEPVRSRDRSISLFPNPGQTSCSNGGGGCSSAAVNGRFLTDFGSQTISNPPNSAPTFADLRHFETSDRFNFAPFQYILTPSERYGAFISLKQDLSDTVHLRVKAEYNRRNSQNQAAFEPLFLGPSAGNGAGSLFDTLSIDKTNPYNPFGVTLESGLNPDGTPNGRTKNYVFVARRLVEAGQRTFNQGVDTLATTATLDGSFHIGDHKWFWDASASIGFNDAKQSFTGNVRADRVAQALGPVALCTAPCVPLNLFGGAGSITAAQLAFIGFTERDRSSQHLADFTANLSGDLFDLPAGPVGIAVGYEHRIQSASFDPDPIIAAGPWCRHPVAAGTRPLQLRRNLRRSPRADPEGAAVLLLAGSDRRGPPCRLFDQRREHDLHRRRSVEADPGPAAARQLCDRLPRAEPRRTVRRALAVRSAAADPCTTGIGGQFDNPIIRANCIAHAFPLAAPGRMPVSCRCSPRATATCGPRSRAACCSARSMRRAGPAIRALPAISASRRTTTISGSATRSAPSIRS